MLLIEIVIWAWLLLTLIPDCMQLYQLGKRTGPVDEPFAWGPFSLLPVRYFEILKETRSCS